MKYFIKIFKESIIIVILSSIFGLFSGTLLSSNDEILYTIPIFLLILPALNSLIGDISTVLVSRLTTHLYIGTILPKIQRSERLKEDFYGLFFTLLLSLGFLIIAGFSVGIISGVKLVNPFLIILIMILTIIILFFMMFILLFLSAIYLFKRGTDPNNFLIPFITSLADFLTPLFIILFITIFI
ncbi:MAG: magnesium transporter [Candidatus Lokiarchaeota archaeon]|nr:magnesium transporter [Candidatus Lokiarchaeota archaeon]